MPHPEGGKKFLTETKTQRIHHERERLDAPFWPNVIDVLNTRNTDALIHRVQAIAEAAPHIPTDLITGFVDTLVEKYAEDKRKFTQEDEVNHALQVGILTAHAIGWRMLSLETFATALGHDLFENTPDTEEEISDRTQPDISRGIVALSHKDNGVKLFHHKRPYFENIVDAHEEDANLELPLIKVIDQIVVANSPLRKEDLADESFAERWERLSKEKLNEMHMFQDVLRTKAPGEVDAQQRLREGIAFTRLRMRPEEGAQLLGGVIFERSQQDLREVV